MRLEIEDYVNALVLDANGLGVAIDRHDFDVILLFTLCQNIGFRRLAMLDHVE